MPFSAYQDRRKTIKIDAKDCVPTDKGKTFYCCTPSCRVEYGIVNAGNTEDAFFRRKPSSPHHISPLCARSSMVFNEQKYEEELYTSDNMFNYILATPGTPTHKGTTGTKHLTCGGRTAVKALRTFYELISERGIETVYNGVYLSDIFATDTNFEHHKDTLIGKKIVEASLYCLADPETILFNYPCDWREEHVLIALRFHNDHMTCLNWYNELKGNSHTEPVILCGNWERWDITDRVGKREVTVPYSCNFISGRQIFDPN